MANLVITYQSPAVLKPRKSNPRTHSKAQLKQIVDSIRTFGFNNPVLVDKDNGSSPATAASRRPSCLASSACHGRPCRH